MNGKIRRLLPLGLIVALLAAGVVLGLKVPGLFRRKIVFSVQVRASLEKVLNINELHTVEYVYNSYAVAYEKPELLELYDRLQPAASSLQAWSRGIQSGQYSYTSVMTWLSAYHAFFGKYTTRASVSAGFTDEDLPLLNALGYADKDALLRDFDTEESYAEYVLLGNLADDISVWSNDGENLSQLSEFVSLSRSGVAKDIAGEKYAVAYEGTVTAGIDKPVTFTVDEALKKIIVHIPAVKILDINVNIPADKENKSVITRSKKYVNSLDWFNEASMLCKTDLTKKIAADAAFLQVARENARNAVRALVSPFERTTGFSFEFEEERQ